MRISLAVLFLSCFPAANAQAQLSFRVGDWVEIRSGSSWIPCIVAAPLERKGSFGYYLADCGITQSYGQADAANMRAHSPTPDELKSSSETKAALARLPRSGNPLGEKFGTRAPFTCNSLKQPLSGAPSAEQARQYFLCDYERESLGTLWLAANAKAQVASTSRPAGKRFLANLPDGIDIRQPTWDIRGSFTSYQCSKQSPNIPGLPGTSAFGRTHNCTATDLPTALGYCYKDTFAGWHCILSDPDHAMTSPRSNVLPPEGN